MKCAIPLGELETANQLYILIGSRGRCLSLSNKDDREYAIEYLGDTHIPTLLVEAQQTQKWLLSFGIDVARPICLSTLHLIQYKKKPPQPLANNAAQAEILAQKLLLQLGYELSHIEKIGSQRIARLECLVTRPFAQLEFRGLPINRKKWASLIQDAQTTMASHTQQGLPADPKIAKLVSTYGENFLGHISADTGRLHGKFEPLGTSTGRASCHSPNLQNLPARQDFRACISAPSGRSLVSADYAACELRILAHFSQEPVFLNAFSAGMDLHSAVATKLFGVPVNKVENPHLRHRAKAISFGIIYGMGANSLAGRLGVPPHEAQQLLRLYFVQHPKIKDYLEQTVEESRSKGFCETLWGRKLIFADHFGPESTEDISRVARNMPIQGTAADMIKLAMISIQERLSGEFSTAFLVNMIHDELVVECKTEDATAIATMLTQEMEKAQLLMMPHVKPLADSHISQSWMH